MNHSLEHLLCLAEKLPLSPILYFEEEVTVNDELLIHGGNDKLLNPELFRREKDLTNTGLLLTFKIWRKRNSRSNHEFDGKWFWAYDSLSHTFYHWMHDILIKLIDCRKYQKDVKVLLPYWYKSYAYISQSLDYLDIEYEYTKPDRNNQFRAIIPYIENEAVFYEKVYYNNARNCFHNLGNTYKAENNIYVTRESAQHRKLLNEQAIKPLFDVFGYQIIALETYPLASQLRLISQAKSLLGVHGAGLIHLLYGPERMRIVEIRNPSLKQPVCFLKLSQILGFDYATLIAQPVESSDPHRSDLIVDEKKLRALLVSL